MHLYYKFYGIKKYKKCGQILNFTKISPSLWTVGIDKQETTGKHESKKVLILDSGDLETDNVLKPLETYFLTHHTTVSIIRISEKVNTQKYTSYHQLHTRYLKHPVYSESNDTYV